MHEKVVYCKNPFPSVPDAMVKGLRNDTSSNAIIFVDSRFHNCEFAFRKVVDQFKDAAHRNASEAVDWHFYGSGDAFNTTTSQEIKFRVIDPDTDIRIMYSLRPRNKGQFKFFGFFLMGDEEAWKGKIQALKLHLLRGYDNFETYLTFRENNSDERKTDMSKKEDKGKKPEEKKTDKKPARDEKGHFTKKSDDGKDGKVEIKIAKEKSKNPYAEPVSYGKPEVDIVGRVSISHTEFTPTGSTTETSEYTLNSDGSMSSEHYEEGDKNCCKSEKKCYSDSRAPIFDVLNEIGKSYPPSITVSGHQYYSEPFVMKRLHEMALCAAEVAASEIVKAKEPRKNATEPLEDKADGQECPNPLPQADAQSPKAKRHDIARRMSRFVANVLLWIIATGLAVSAIQGLRTFSQWFMHAVSM